MAKILVGSVFSGTASNADNARWYSLQLAMLRVSSPGHQIDHAVSLSQGQVPDPFGRSRVVFSGEKPAGPSSLNHATHLHYLLDYFKQRRDDYDFFLFLDSDAFPYQPKWLAKTVAAMGSHTVAAVVRVEDLVWFPHPCACLVKPAGLDVLNWLPVWAEGGIDGLMLYDPGVAMREMSFYPLIRTNRVNVHPLLCGIYGRAFYHHGAASRPGRSYRGAALYEIPALTDKWQATLFRDPRKFFNSLDW